jgi:hypothetical protein
MKVKYDFVNNEAKHPLIMVLIVGLFFFMLLVLIVIVFSDYSKTYFYSSMPLGVVGIISFVWLQLRPNLYARFLTISCHSGLSLLIACRAFGNLFPHIASPGILIITSIVLFFHSLPVWNADFANFLREELSSPKTKFSKTLYKLVLLFVPMVGIAGIVLGRISQDSNKRSSLVFLFIFLFMAIIMPLGSQSPSSPWESNAFKK